MDVTRISFVCLGNICRSPMAEGIFKHLAQQAGAEREFAVESSGVGGWHAGEAPDGRARQTTEAHGIKLNSTARKFVASDFARLDWVIALDGDVAASLRQLAPTFADRQKVRLMREFDPQRGAGDEDLDVPDPYYGGLEGFQVVYEMIDRSSREMVAQLRKRRRGL